MIGVRGCYVAYEERSMQYDWDGRKALTKEPTIGELIIICFNFLLGHRSTH